MIFYHLDIKMNRVMNSAESLARKKIVILYFALTGIAFGVSLVLCIVGVLNGGITEIGRHVALRVVFPSLVNLISSIIAKYVNNSLRFDNDFKCSACSYTLATIGGSIAFWNGYYASLWVLPILAVMFCSIFRDMHLLFKVTIYSIILVGVSAFFTMLQYPENYRYYMESMVIVMIVLASASLISRNIIIYNKEMQNIVYDAREKQDTYKFKLETDQLTFLHTRPYAQEKADLFLLSASPEHPVSLAVVDLDFFKKVNDTYGHKNGDVVLWKFGDTVNKNMIDNLVVGRYGGEEFIFAFDGGNGQDHIDYMNSLLEKFRSVKYKFTDQSITFSCGIVTTTFPTTFSEAFSYADMGVYKSKENGRNQVTAYIMPKQDQG